METELPKGFEPAKIEARWYAHSLEHGVFCASDDPEDDRPRYTLPMPLPNVTGSLHMGHAMMCTLEDILTRVHRMRGYNTLYYPGTDHAGIATQVVVERQLKRDGISRHDLGRDQFLDRVWTWKAECGGHIVAQQKRLGLSADWDRSKFTMDPDMCRAVREAFVRLYDEGLIYRAERLIYWDCVAQTVLSNLEVNQEEENGELFEFAYPIAPEDGGGELVVATTRAETMLGDTAVAVHPDDERYRHLHGKYVVHPFLDRRIPIITDAILVDPKFGTGAVKVTPAHDPNDFETGQRHDLPLINILDEHGKVNAEGGTFAGLDRFAARKAVKAALEEKGLSRGEKVHRHAIPRSDRTGSVVEPMLSTQWFVKTKPLADPALEAVRRGETVIIPAEWTKTYEHWMTNILDWCISRQLWWGHRIPAWYCDDCGHINVVNAEELSQCQKCSSNKVQQDEDVLDTWFSSALWPLSTQGWPDDTPQLRRFYPASDLETGYDILFFWVARMMMMGIHFMGKPPFSRILLHSLVVDETGRKMSKVTGNVIDPLDLIDGASFETVVGKALPGAPVAEALRKFKKAYPSSAQMGKGFEAYGTDALRFTLASYSTQSKRIPLSPKKIEGYRHFCNKIWNATRFALPHTEGAQHRGEPPAARALVNRWILSRLGAACGAAAEGIDGFRFDEAASALYRFFWGELCDWYLELCKPVFSGHDLPGVGADEMAALREETRDTLAYALETSLRALHPFMPFITEELWQRLPRPEPSPVSVALAEAPGRDAGRADPDAERAMAAVQAIITAARTIRSERNVHPGARVPLALRTDDEALRALLDAERNAIETLVKTDGPLVVEGRGGARPQGAALSVAADVEVLVTLKGIVDAAKEKARVEREIKKTEKDIAALDKKLANKGFAERAPAEVVAESRAALESNRERLRLLQEALELASELE
ncbi:MAG: valine--tRNA ligase [Deltaproteobacteria bacterium]|jgi:valyl-tRNA synthetase|nr:valine--tRNA ligase [Deltaproteobacteria bacterium]MBW2535418.1 valine--tRNA ligase [Deltaproteobacteria bacterium]